MSRPEINVDFVANRSLVCTNDDLDDEFGLMSTLGAPLNDPPKEDQTEEEKFPTTEDELYQLFLKAVLHRFQTYAQPSDDFEADDYETHASTKEKAVSAVDRSTKVMKIVGLQAVLLDQSVHYYYMYLRGHYPSQQTLKGDINKAISAAENQIIQILEVWEELWRDVADAGKGRRGAHLRRGHSEAKPRFFLAELLGTREGGRLAEGCGKTGDGVAEHPATQPRGSLAVEPPTSPCGQ
jgi:hypothetical protein